MSNKILVVDDEKNIRMTLTHCLKGLKYDIRTAVNGEDALNLVKEQDFDLILLDIKMPGLNGMQVLKRLRDNGNNISVIMMTAYGTVEKAVESMKLGAIDFISKPFTPNEIKELVRDVIQREQLKENELNSFKDYIEFAKMCIVKKNYIKAEQYLKKAMEREVDAPEPHNLLGILAEYRYDLQLAQKHYRAALALDPTYRPADKNLERTAQLNYTQSGMQMGDEENNDENKEK